MPSYQFIKNHLADLMLQGTSLHYKKGQVLFYQEHLPYGFYLLREGKVGQTFHDELTHVEPSHGEFLGLVHLLSNTVNCTTCQAESDVEVLFFTKAAVFEFLKKKGDE